jgi:hypothetical protein
VYVRLFVLVRVIVIDRSCRLSLYVSITITSTVPPGRTEHEHDLRGEKPSSPLMKYPRLIGKLTAEQIHPGLRALKPILQCGTLFNIRKKPAFVKVIALKSYRTGYLGFVEESDQYVLFSCARHGAIKYVMCYDKADFFNHDHFLSVITKFVPRSFFLEEGVELETLSVAALDQISRERRKPASNARVLRG